MTVNYPVFPYVKDVRIYHFTFKFTYFLMGKYFNWFLKCILLIMLLQLSHFFSPLSPSTLHHPSLQQLQVCSKGLRKMGGFYRKNGESGELLTEERKGFYLDQDTFWGKGNGKVFVFSSCFKYILLIMLL